MIVPWKVVVAIVGASAVTVVALLEGLDGQALAFFFGFLGGLGLATQNGSQQNTSTGQ